MVDVNAELQAHDTDLRRMARGFKMPSGGDRDDLVQEARLAVWDALRTYDAGRGPFWPYAKAAAWRAMNTACARARREPSRPSKEETIEFIAPPVEPLVGPGTRKRTILAMLSLEDDERTILVLHFDRHQSMRDLALLLGVSVRTVYLRIHRALERMRKMAEKEAA